MSIATPSTAPPGREEIEYPSSDGEPMAETGLHVQAILLLFQALLDSQPVTDFVAADMYWFWEEDHPESRVAPDVMVVKGGGRSHRRSFFTWREGGAVPCVVFEMASENTWREDLGKKRRLYERLGVREYFLFDPEGEYLRPRMIGFRLIEGRYELIEPDQDDRLRSEELGVMLTAEGLMLRLSDGTTGAPVPTSEERVEQERLHAEQQRQRADALAEEVERLKALLKQRNGSGGGGSGSAE